MIADSFIEVLQGAVDLTGMSLIQITAQVLSLERSEITCPIGTPMYKKSY